MLRLWIVCGIVFLTAWAQNKIGVLIMAHGGQPTWNENVKKIVEPITKQYPTAIAFGMANPKTLKEGLQTLESQGVTHVIAVPLFISEHSPILEQTRYLLGLQSEPPEQPMVMLHHFMDFFQQLKKHFPAAAYTYVYQERPSVAVFEAMVRYHVKDEALRSELVERYQKFLQHYQMQVQQLKPIAHGFKKIVLTSALGAHPLVAQILYERILALSKAPEKETIILVAHGPNEETYNQRWLEDMEKLAQQIDAMARQHERYYRGIFCVTVRDDAPPLIYEQAKNHLRALVRQAGRSGTALVVPLLLSEGGIEKGIERRLQGLRYRWNGKALLPHPAITQWIQLQIEQAKATL